MKMVDTPLYAYSIEGPDRRLKRGHCPNTSYVTFEKTFLYVPAGVLVSYWDFGTVRICNHLVFKHARAVI